MKRNVLFLFAALSVLPPLAADPYSPWKIGIFGGASQEDFVHIDSSQAPIAARLGIVGHILPFLSIRAAPILFVTKTEYENILAGYPPHDSNKEDYLGGQVDVLLHFLRFASGSLYVGPSVTFYHFQTESFGWTGTKPYRSSITAYSEWDLGAVFGGQYLLDPHFGIFLDLGFKVCFGDREYWSYASSEAESGHTVRNTIDTRFSGATLGVIFYFN